MQKNYGVKPKQRKKKVYTRETLTFGKAASKWITYIKKLKGGETYVEFLENIDDFLEEMEYAEDWETVKEESCAAGSRLLDMLTSYSDQWELWQETPIAKLDKAIADTMYNFSNKHSFKNMYSLFYASALSHFIDYVNGELLHCSWRDNLYESKKATLWVIHRYEFEYDYDDEKDFERMFKETFNEDFDYEDYEN